MNKEDDDSTGELQLKNGMNFLESMRFCKEDAILLDPECCKKCHDRFTRGKDRGRVTLVNAK